MSRRKKEHNPEQERQEREELERRANRSAEINTWRPKKSEVITESDGNIFIVNFDKVFHDPNAAKYNKFCVKKSSYEEHLKIYAQYINYFINKYDTENELVSAYYK